MSKIGIITGLQVETTCLDNVAPHLRKRYSLRFCAGGNLGRARYGANFLIQNGAKGLVSFGIAGALDRQLQPGDIVIGTTIIDGSGNLYQSDENWLNNLKISGSTNSPCFTGSIVSVEQPILTASGKYGLFSRFNSMAVDMESAGVAAAATANGIPFIAIRAIADPANRNVPSCASAGQATDGTMKPLAVTNQLLRRPWEVANIIRLAQDLISARSTLSRVAMIGF